MSDTDNQSVSCALAFLGAFANQDADLMRDLISSTPPEDMIKGLTAVAMSTLMEVSRLLSGEKKGSMVRVQAMLDHLLLADSAALFQGETE
jgi:hypothetical protein